MIVMFVNIIILMVIHSDTTTIESSRIGMLLRPQLTASVIGTNYTTKF